ncbi:unnamed protein product [Blepharisma stoltei]|uniref:Uncharacterized protein n=1 Tax=Blepharisma stoltei TaxID=1481888 RepID=A0AAU9JH37_9CILI|nr:unnamed protein product [Blepharisma stoltei]
MTVSNALKELTMTEANALAVLLTVKPAIILLGNAILALAEIEWNFILRMTKLADAKELKFLAGWLALAAQGLILITSLALHALTYAVSAQIWQESAQNAKIYL